MRIENKELEQEIRALPKAAGVYAIFYRPTRKIYIGGSTDVRERVRQHIYKATRVSKDAHPMASDVLTFGQSGLHVELLESVARYSDLAEREQFWQDKLLTDDNAYNPTRLVKPNYNW